MSDTSSFDAISNPNINASMIKPPLSPTDPQIGITSSNKARKSVPMSTHKGKLREFPFGTAGGGSQKHPNSRTHNNETMRNSSVKLADE